MIKIELQSDREWDNCDKYSSGDSITNSSSKRPYKSNIKNMVKTKKAKNRKLKRKVAAHRLITSGRPKGHAHNHQQKHLSGDDFQQSKVSMCPSSN